MKLSFSFQETRFETTSFETTHESYPNLLANFCQQIFFPQCSSQVKIVNKKNTLGKVLSEFAIGIDNVFDGCRDEILHYSIFFSFGIGIFFDGLRIFLDVVSEI
jgi:hypothetical protein